MRRLLILITLSLLAALVIPSVASAEPEQLHYDLSQDLSGVEINPCNGEPIAVEGFINERGHAVIDDDPGASIIHFNAHATLHLMGVGLVSGERYVVHIVDTRNTNISENGADVDMNRYVIKYEAQGNDVPDFYGALNSRIVIGPDGEPRLVVHSEPAECR
jgi:hypothetical protein